MPSNSCAGAERPHEAKMFKHLMQASSLWRTLNRVHTFSLWPIQLNQEQKKKLIAAGFVYTGRSDEVRCCVSPECNLFHWGSKDDPWIEHAKWFASCPFVLCTAPASSQPSSISLLGSSAIDFSDPSYYASRVKTFGSFYSAAGRFKLASAGFVFVRNCNKVMCFIGGCLLHNAETCKNPYSVHAFINKDCPFILATSCAKSQVFREF
jgi:hypothetical protein